MKADNRKVSFLALGCALTIALFSARLQAQQNVPDLILHNGKILTVDKDFTTAEAIAIQGDKILAVGSDQEILAMAGPNTQKMDMKGRTVIPGLIDTHNHIHDYAEHAYGGYIGYDGLKAYPVDFSGVRNTEDALDQIRQIVEKYKFPPNDWQYFAPTALTGGGEDANDARTKVLFDGLTRWQLDKVAPNFGMMMALGFPNANGVVANSIVIEELFKKHGDFLLKNGRYWIDSSGRPDGHLEAPAVRLATAGLVQPDPKLVAKIYEMYANELNAEGVTTLSTRIPQYAIQAFKYLDSTGQLTLRLPYGLEQYFGNLQDLDQLKTISKQMNQGDDKFWVVSIAPSAVDGAGIRSCSSLPREQKFSSLDAWWPAGECILDQEYKGAKGAPISENYFRNWIMKSGEYGARFANTHITGDRSIKMMLGMMDQLVKQYGPNSVKGWAFDHCFLVDPSDLPHIAKLGVMFSCYSQVGGVASIAATWGEKVAQTYSIPVNSMMKAGINAAYESDGDKSKWRDLEWFMDRKDPTGKVWGPQEELNHEQVLRYFTINGAKYVLRPGQIGSLEAGKLADLTVLDQDFMATAPAQMKDMHPQMTMVGGKIVFATPDFADENGLRGKPGIVVSTLAELKTRRKLLQVSRR